MLILLLIFDWLTHAAPPAGILIQAAFQKVVPSTAPLTKAYQSAYTSHAPRPFSRFPEKRVTEKRVTRCCCCNQQICRFIERPSISGWSLFLSFSNLLFYWGNFYFILLKYLGSGNPPKHIPGVHCTVDGCLMCDAQPHLLPFYYSAWLIVLVLPLSAFLKPPFFPYRPCCVIAYNLYNTFYAFSC